MSHPLVKVKRANILICFKQSSVARKQNKKRAVVKDTRVVHLTVTPFSFISTKLPIPLSKTLMVIAWRNLLFAIPDLPLFRFSLSLRNHEQVWRIDDGNRLPKHRSQGFVTVLWSHVGWVCCLSTLLEEVFLKALRFSPPLQDRQKISFYLNWTVFLARHISCKVAMGQA